MNIKDYPLKQILKAIEDSKGSINTISKRLNCSWHTAKKMIDKHEEAKIARQDEIEKMCDTAEAVVYEKIEEEKDLSAAKWYLSTIGRERGYSEKSNIEIDIKGSLLEKMARLFFDE